jgi:hypothetical protein
MFDLTQFISIRQLVDFAIALTLLEGIVFVVYHRMTGLGVAPKDFALNLISGLCLMLALRCALLNGGWMWISACLSAAGLAHATDITLRWKRQRQRY